ncbi:MAG: tetratricopeptide repeat protein [Deltaproteobacteria bacterium]|nr:tetratricopeptide repeat protein [Deltaproteobacteria bacterium]
MVTKKDKHLAAAQKYLERGSFEKALAMFQAAVREDPKDTRTWLRMAEVHVRLGQNDKATEVYQKTVDLYVEQGFFQRAVAVYKNIIKLAPEFIEARLKLAEVFRQLGLLSDAVQQLEQASALYLKANRSPEALAALKQIVDLNPEQPNPRIRYAEMASQAGALKEAAAEFAEAARLVKAQGRTDEFLRVAERMLHYDPQNHDMALEVAAKYVEHGNARAALPHLKVVFEAKPREPQVLDLLARAFDQLGQPHRTLPVLKELARVYAEAGRISERNHAAQRVLAMDPNDAEMRELLGRGPSTLARLQTVSPVPLSSGTRLTTPSPIPTPPPGSTAAKRPTAITFSEVEVPAALRNRYATPSEPMPATMSERITIASGMVEKSDDDVEVKRILAEADVFVKYGLVERAAEHLRRVFERVPTHQGAHERLAVVLEQLDRKAEAAAEYETLAQQVLASKPRNAAAYARKALALNPAARRATEVLGAVEGSMPEAPHGDASTSEELPVKTPEPDHVGSDEIELLSDVSDSDEFEGQEGGSAFERGQDTTGGGAIAPAEEYDDYNLEEGGSTQIGAPVFPEAERQPAAAREREPSPSVSDDAFLADLEQVDFFIEQGLVDEATAMLDELETRTPGHILVADRRDKLSALAPAAATSQGAMPAQVHGGPDAAAPDMRATMRNPPDAGQPKNEKHDIDTHVDLGIMEKTMERYDAAITHFKAALADHGREVFALSMIGECHEALGDSAEAIRCYQDALKRPTATSAEATQLYFQLGNVFYNLGDHSEALYYFERVYKRDPNFRDITRRLAEVKSRAASR